MNAWELVKRQEWAAELSTSEGAGVARIVRIEETFRMHVPSGTLYRHQTILLADGTVSPAVSTALVFVPEQRR